MDVEIWLEKVNERGNMEGSVTDIRIILKSASNK
jgi:hypothetical protein